VQGTLNNIEYDFRVVARVAIPRAQHRATIRIGRVQDFISSLTTASFLRSMYHPSKMLEAGFLFCNEENERIG
jgi:hypothetical protein